MDETSKADRRLARHLERLGLGLEGLEENLEWQPERRLLGVLGQTTEPKSRNDGAENTA